MFKKILIANRGEIACRVIKTARKMGIKTVAIYSDADVGALHVRMADEAVPIGSAPSSESYLVIDKIMQAIRQTGAEAVHPGYGFLSENKFFAEALAAADITFIGPPKAALEAMGDKIQSKKLALAAGVNCIPGHMQAISDPKEAVKIANQTGYPVMLKASAGGGGKGMRLARNDAECREGLVSAMNEGQAAFGDGRVFIEKFIEHPRHIEIQIMADKHGNILYFGERECSIQRRHQKVLEEAPSPFLDEATRKAMGEQAVALAKKVDYCSAGTVEFIVDKGKNFYFLEMNTRLQVEHPVTELVTGYDLVELMIRVANNEKLPMQQKDVKLTGWALEARLYAEDPERGFLPSTGRLVEYRPPQEIEGKLRVDTGVEEGAEISIFYDPMIAKLITGGKDRKQAFDTMQHALNLYRLRGPSHNIDFLNQLCGHAEIRTGKMTTDFIGAHYPNGLTKELLEPKNPKLFAAVASLIHMRELEAEQALSGRITPAEPFKKGRFSAFLGEQDKIEYKINIKKRDDTHMDDTHVMVKVDGEKFNIDSCWRPWAPIVKTKVNDVAVVMQLDRTEGGNILSHNGARVRIQMIERRLAHLLRLMPYKQPPDLSGFLLSPMPGLLVRLAVAEGDRIKAGGELAVVEAMKMENILRAKQDLTIKAVCANQGDNLAVDQKILEFE